MPQIYIIVESHVARVLMSQMHLLEPELVSAVEEGFGLEGLDDVALTIPAPAFYTKGEMDIQVEIRYTAGEDEYDRGEPFNPSLEKQELLNRRIGVIFLNFFHKHNLQDFSISVWCKPYYNSAFEAFKAILEE